MKRTRCSVRFRISMFVLQFFLYFSAVNLQKLGSCSTVLLALGASGALQGLGLVARTAAGRGKLDLTLSAIRRDRRTGQSITKKTGTDHSGSGRYREKVANVRASHGIAKNKKKNKSRLVRASEGRARTPGCRRSSACPGGHTDQRSLRKSTHFLIRDRLRIRGRFRGQHTAYDLCIFISAAAEVLQM